LHLAVRRFERLDFGLLARHNSDSFLKIGRPLHRARRNRVRALWSALVFLKKKKKKKKKKCNVSSGKERGDERRA
jgi:hypothetical protein